MRASPRKEFEVRPGAVGPAVVAYFFVEAYRRGGRLNELKRYIVLGANVRGINPRYPHFGPRR
jgi:hypothetical protein